MHELSTCACPVIADIEWLSLMQKVTLLMIWESSLIALIKFEPLRH